MSTGDELRAAVGARRDLGPDFEDAIVESFLEKMGQEVDRRVDERLATLGPKGKGKGKNVARQPGPSEGQRLALAIVSLALGTVLTLAVIVGGKEMWVIAPIWFAVIVINGIFGSNRN
ncbi:hypothetical protein [Nonomuraea sp. NEAU-A123]|uniref:hypothetical protein n=1 Tax=Nonomuraea sp. NEAU-A123 TaxID=2839649 RepID=UPI001BE3F877|nr:hypothetical protein [Nonomuraea sp. NEAU-A123]MBT2227107.1 hypothetical protein [Nonomuraea sp. NEAU-A123]